MCLFYNRIPLTKNDQKSGDQPLIIYEVRAAVSSLRTSAGVGGVHLQGKSVILLAKTPP